MRRPIASRNDPDRVRRYVLAVAVCLASLAAAQQRPLDNPAEAFFDSLDTRLYVDSLPPKVTPPATWPPRLSDLLPQAPLFTEQREPVLQIDFDNYNMAANPQRLLYLEPDHLALVADDRNGQALRIDNPGTLLTGISRPLDPNQLAGRTLELSARVKLEAPYRQEDGAESWFQPVVQMRWERPHPDAQKRLEGETLRTWDTIFSSPRGPLSPGTFVPDGRFHTYRCRLFAPEDLTGAMLQVVVQRCAAAMQVDDIALSIVGTRAERLFRQGAALKQGNLLGWRAAFDLGVLAGGVTSERRLSPLTDTTNGRDFGGYRFVPGGDGRTAIAVTARPGRSAALELPWLGLAAGQPYTMSLWVRSDHDGTMVAFGVGDVNWQLLGRRVLVGKQWQRFAAGLTAGQTHQQAFWPWVTVLGLNDTDVTAELDGLQLEVGNGMGPYQPPAGIGVALDTGAPPAPGLRNVYGPDEPVKLIARLLQRGGDKRTAKLRCVVESHLGRAWRTLANTPDTVDLPPGQPVEVPLLAGPLPRGLYRFWVEATDQASGDVTRAERIVGVFPPARTRRFGFHDGPGDVDRTAAVAAAASRVGATMVATNGCPTADWRQHWTGEGRHDFSLFDLYVDGWNAQGLGIVHTLGPDLAHWPDWVMERYGKQFATPQGRDEAILPPSKLWEAYVRDVATRYAGRIAAYEVLSGPDLELCPAEYLPLLQNASKVVREADPKALVAAPGAVDAASALPGGWLDQLFAAGAAGSLDVLSVQLSADYPEQLDAARDHLRELAARFHLQLWDTSHEYAEPPLLTDRLNPRGEVNHDLLPFSDHPYDGAAFYARHELLLAAAGFERSFLGPAVAEVEYLHEPVGMMCEIDGSPRSSLAALAVIAHEVGDARPLGEWRWDLTQPGVPADYDYRRYEGLRAVAFATGEDRALVAWWTWQRDCTLSVEFPAAAKARMFVTTGEELAPPDDGKVLLTHAPLYLADLPRAALDQLAEVMPGGRRPTFVPPPAR